MKKISFIVVVGLLLFCACESEKPFRDELKETVDMINKKCPAMLDSETRIENVEIKEPNTLYYKYTLVNVFTQNVDTHKFYMHMWPGLLSTIKISPEMKKLRENSTIVQYYYQDKLSNPIYLFTVKPEHYK